MINNITKLELGDKLMLFKIDRQEKAYKDQYNVFHAAWVVLEEVEITVSEIKEVDGDYRSKDKYLGLRLFPKLEKNFFKIGNIFQ